MADQEVGTWRSHTVTVPFARRAGRGLVTAACTCGWRSAPLPHIWAWKAGQGHLDAERAGAG